MSAFLSGDRFDARVIIVTGAGSGIGQAAAIAFAQQGAVVYGIDVDRQGLRRTTDALPDRPHRFISIEADVSSPSHVTSSAHRVLAEAGRVDVLVNNAGIGMAKRITDLEVDDWDRVFDTNLRSAYLYSKAVWPYFVTHQSGAIVNIASVMGQVGGVGSPAYCSAKAGMIMLSRCLAKEGAPDGIRVNCICPGYIDTPIMERSFQQSADPPKARADVLAKMPSRRMGTAEDIASSIVFLASADAAYISGAELTIDGAVTATQID